MTPPPSVRKFADPREGVMASSGCATVGPGYRHSRLTLGAALLLGGIYAVPHAYAEVVRGAQPDTGLAFWRWESDGVSVELVQRLPDQTRAFFQGRGFDSEPADAFALGCVFQTIFRNTATDPGAGGLDYDMAQWRVVTPSGRQAPRLKEQWDREWAARGVSQAARIAFRWALLPNRQGFEPGDYNWGMTSYGLPPGERFDLELVWSRGGKRETALIPDIECPRDIHP